MKIAIYSDINTFKSDNGQPLVEDIQAVLQALYNLLTTDIGERRYRFRLGLSISDYIFESFDSINAFQLKNELLTAIREQEPRVEPIFSLSEVIQDPTSNSYKLKLVFSLLGLGEKRFEFYGAVFR